MQAAAVPCQGCGAPIDPSRASYDKAGRLVCKSCEANAQIVEGDYRATQSIFGAAMVVGALTLASLTCFNPFLITTGFAFVGAVTWMRSASRLGPAHKAQLGSRLTLCWVVVSISFALSLGVIALATLGIAAGTLLGR